MESLLANLQIVCPSCDTLGSGAAHCPSCGAPTAGPPSPGATPVRPTWSEGNLAPRSARLVLLRGLGVSGSTFALDADENRAGRSEGAVRFPADDTLPAHAATFYYEDGKLFVRDEEGPAGVLVKIRHQAPLAEGGSFSLGDHLFRYVGPFERPLPRPTSPKRVGSALPEGPLLRLEKVLLGGVVGRSYLLAPSIRIGRLAGDIVLGDDPFVSARHCAVHHHEDGAILQDLGSSNGTFLRLPPQGTKQLLRGDVLRLGRNILRVE